MKKTEKEKVFTVNGHKMKLSDIPLHIFTLKCGHQKKDYGVLAGDWYFCDQCEERKKITKIVL